MDVFFLSLLVVLIGGALTFAGYQAFRVLLPIWGFFAGFILGSQVVTSIFGTAFLSTLTSWIVGGITAVAMAAVAYVLYEVAVGILAASIGYWLAYGLLWQIGMHTSGLDSLLALAAGIALGIATVYYKAPKALMILLTGAAGATAVIGGLLIMFNQAPVGVLGTNLVGAIIAHSVFWTISWIALAAIGIASQFSLSQRMGEAGQALESQAGEFSLSGDSMSYAGAKGGEATAPTTPEDDDSADAIDAAQLNPDDYRDPVSTPSDPDKRY